MSKTIDLLNEARSVVASIMEAEGEFTEEQEDWLQGYLKKSKDQAAWLGHLYRRGKAEADIADREIRRLMAVKKKANRTSSWARQCMLDFLVLKQDLGEATNITGVAHLMRKKTLLYPDSPEDWPAKFLIEQAPRLDTTGLKKAFKNKDLPDGFRWDESYTVVMK